MNLSNDFKGLQHFQQRLNILGSMSLAKAMALSLACHALTVWICLNDWFGR
jgi:hypothetical protein